MYNIAFRVGLTLRSGPKDRVSKGGIEHLACCPSFETHRRAMLLRMRSA
jgi:hypothetical protein